MAGKKERTCKRRTEVKQRGEMREETGREGMWRREGITGQRGQLISTAVKNRN